LGRDVLWAVLVALVFGCLFVVVEWWVLPWWLSG
jgi:hypothetical protein